MPQHIPLKSLFACQREELSHTEKSKIHRHLAECENCAQNAELISQLYRPPDTKSADASGHAGKANVPKETACPSTETVGKFMTGELSGSEHRDVEKHLAACDGCRKELAEIFRVSVAPVSEEEQALLESLPPVEISEAVRKIMELMPPAPEKPRLVERLPHWLRPHIPELRLPRPAWGFAMVALLAVGYFAAREPYREWRGRVHASAGIAEMQKAFALTEDDLRPAVDIPLSIFSTTHGGESAEGVDPVLAKFQEALAWDPTNRAAKRGLAAYWYLQRNFASAETLLGALVAQDSLDYETWNNLGLIAAQREDTAAALAAFERVLQIRPNFAPAAFNRAALLQQTGRLQEAKAAWQDYLEIDSASEWAKLAHRQLSSIHSP
jgi:anti-sigma factor RsiW